jgi:hypothetical protein
MNRIKHMLFLGALIALAGIGAQRAVADTPQLLDLWFNEDGTFVQDPGTGAPGVNEGGLNETTGLGTITFTDTTAGGGYFNMFINEAVGTPYWNEYGTAFGSTSSGETWEIGNVPYISGSPSCAAGATLPGYVDTCSSAYTDAQNGSLSDTNGQPLGSSANFNTGDCVSSTPGTCNGDVAAALGQSYSVIGNGDEEMITVTISQTAPSSGFYIDQTNPNEDDPTSGVQGNVYYSLSADYIPAGTTTVTPEPSTWLLMLSGLAILAWRMRSRFAVKSWAKFTALLALIALALGASARAQKVLTVPEDPANPAEPHTAYAGANIVLGATFTGAVSGHTYTYSWSYGDGSAPTTPVTITSGAGTPSFNDLSSSHVYSGTTPGVTSWTAVLTVNDTTASLQYTGNYLVIWENNTLQTRVNVAIDWGLWYLHQNMYHQNYTAIGPGTLGSWSKSCAPGYPAYSCGNGYGSLDANNVQAFEVNGHLPNGPATDPYTADVAEGVADMLTYLSQQSVSSKSYSFNPATANYGCSDGTSPSSSYSSSNAYCDPSSTPVYYEASSTSCGSPPCSFTFDGNSNGLAVYAPQSGSWGYEPGMYADALVASGAPNLTAASLPTPSGSFNGSLGTESFKNIVQDIADLANYCQYGGNNDVPQGYERGYPYAYQGGGWWYNCQEGNDNSVSQWAAIGLIAANRGFGITIPQIVPDANNVWVTDSQNVQTTDYALNSAYNSDTVDNPAGAAGYNTDGFYNYGGFGYNGSLGYDDYYSSPWGPWADTPSGMVQMSLDGVGRSNNTTFGNASNAPDQRFNNAETYYADNFCDPLTGTYSNSYYTPRNYTYGMFSFTKSMLLHNPNGTLQPIQYLRTLTPGVFTTNSSDPANTIDWYAALSPANGGTDACDGVAQTLIGRQYAQGFWYGSNANSGQYSYETAWALIMLQKSVFVACVNNLSGAGTKLRGTGGLIDLTWTGIPSASGYIVLRGTANGGPYTQIGTTSNQSYADSSGLLQNNTYYYVLQPTNASGTALCQSNQATITVP